MGAAGGGKSSALLMGALQFVEVPGYAAIIFRRTLADLKLPGASSTVPTSGSVARHGGQATTTPGRSPQAPPSASGTSTPSSVASATRAPSSSTSRSTNSPSSAN